MYDPILECHNNFFSKSIISRTTTFILLGKVRSGFWPKAIFIEVINDENTWYGNYTDTFTPVINNWEPSYKKQAVV
jgi:hypothetical protein